METDPSDLASGRVLEMELDVFILDVIVGGADVPAVVLDLVEEDALMPLPPPSVA